MAITKTAAGKAYPLALWLACDKEYTWAATSPQTTTYDTDAKRRKIALDRVTAMAAFQAHHLEAERILASFSGTV